MKTKMLGFIRNYKKIMSHVEEINTILYHMGYGLDDAPYHGWTGESLKIEKDIFKSVSDKVSELQCVLIDTIDESK